MVKCFRINSSHIPKTTNGRLFLSQNGNIRATVGSLADIDLFFCWPTHVVFVGPSYIFSCVGGRILQLKQSLNCPSNSPRSSSDHRKTIWYVYRWSVDIYAVGIFLNVGRYTSIDDRKSTEGRLVRQAILVNLLTNGWPFTVFFKHLLSIARLMAVTWTTPCLLVSNKTYFCN